ncbi:phosphomevalonate kinase [Elasticomyces elasticus]|uniref:Phosphomevalonate kinase n=1 Tax=Exophiala sideris TaxID=1016849 RepID=A0ABR0JHH6_9EURO|nr:phosphomevalonate kinase [Elasticomyces elasticus]KAK5033588.1 phosphomevalonate kinase [Exophiala sideris]KAK5041917.1 phosphomevalonate kinase [Exophiala sideris]KAK5064132.1 phosphomevalonate kinase [Exophiala sideris]KAK5185185.1 phosphomevalonate kinase [Eurotiomycetes sp. CCFEE 6388]
MSPSAVAISAPGKVLFAGGFLVLDRKHTGLVFGLNARIHVRIEPWEQTLLELTGDCILVQSPQFLDARWLYKVSQTNSDEGCVLVEQVQSEVGFTTSANKFVETTLRYVLTYISQTTKDVGGNVQISILADDDYYSQSTQIIQRSGTAFSNFGVNLSEAHKTGLGSSAALVTSLAGALLAHYSSKSSADAALPHHTIHNLAQAAHCAAQGKVGSGFDVAAAVFGSCLYRRFSPTILEAIGEHTSPGFGKQLRLCVDDLDLERKWDVEVASHAVKIPDSLILVMCDVDCGSETPGMVRKVLQWHKEKSDEASLLWIALQKGQEELCQELRRLAEVEGIGEHGFKDLGDIILTIRSLVREMSTKSEVPVEPPVISELLDYCTSFSGVVGGVAPGAGGYDAVALLVKNDEEVIQELRDRLNGWKCSDDSGASIGNVRLLGVKQANEGIRREEVNQYSGWL